MASMQGITVALEDGAAHAVDSSEMAFKLAAQYAFRTAFTKASPVVLEPIMTVQVLNDHRLSSIFTTHTKQSYLSFLNASCKAK